MAVGLPLPPLLPLHPHCTIQRSHNHRFRNPCTFSPISCSSSSTSTSSSSSWEREESRWLREEQRWLREEQRWIREESRWNSERESLLREVVALRMRVETLQRRRRKPVDDDDEFDGIDVDVGEAKPPAVLVEEADVKEMMVVEEGRVETGVEEEKKKEGRRVLRKGAEGEDVKEMQEALEKLGFYSGEEDMEFSIFSIGTERAVKTWQASLGAREDGIMSSELLEKLFVGPVGEGAGSKVKSDQENDKMTGTDKSLPEGGTNGAPFSSVTEINQTAIDTMEVDIPEHRVFLLGENRWEEPSRLVSRDKPTNGSKPTSSKKCLTCRGEGRLMCTECDGTGEPNIEPQFLEWVDEGTKCPYCEGLGYTTCDVCEGKTVIDN